MLKILNMHGWSPRAKHHWAMALLFVGIVLTPWIGMFNLIPLGWSGWLLGLCANYLSPEIPENER